MRYIHLLYSNSIHIRNIIRFISDGFSSDNHIFITSSKELVKSCTDYSIIYEEKIDISYILKKYIDNNSVVILHSMIIPTRKLLFIRKKQLNRIVWVVWGHDLYVTEEDGTWGKIKTCLKKVRRKINFVKLKHLCAIGVGYQHDALEIRSLSSEVPILNMLYFQQKDPVMDETEQLNGKSNFLRVMIGHSAFRFLHHIPNLLRLSKFKNENIIISLVLTYGSKDYAEEVIYKAEEIFGKEKVEVIKENKSFEDYVNYIKSIDIAILDYKHQAALGNLFLLMYFGKKVFLNPKGILYQGAISEGWKPYSTECIEKIDFNEFSKKCDINSVKRMKEVSSYYYDKNIALNNWSIAFQEIKRIVSENE